MKLNKNTGRFTALLIVIASTAIALDAEDNKPLKDILSSTRIVQLSGLPKAAYTGPIESRPMPCRFFFGNNGVEITQSQAIDLRPSGPSDPRFTEGKVTCLFTTERISMPPSLPVLYSAERRPTIETKPVKLVDPENKVPERQINVQVFTALGLVTDNYGTVSQNKLECFKVGDAPFNAADLKSALGQSIRVEIPGQAAEGPPGSSGRAKRPTDGLRKILDDVRLYDAPSMTNGGSAAIGVEDSAKLKSMSGRNAPAETRFSSGATVVQ